MYDAVIPPFTRQLVAMIDLVAIAKQACVEGGLDEKELLQAKLHPTMHAFAYQVKSTAEHSHGSIVAIRLGAASPNIDTPPDTLDGLTAKLDGALQGISEVSSEEMERLLDKEVRFEWKTTRLSFSSQNFLLSYAIPNFYFHVTTAYAIMRMKGLSIGKLNFLGRIPATAF